MSEKKGSKAKVNKVTEAEAPELPSMSSKAELKTFLCSIRDRLFANSAPPIHALSALQYVFKLPNVYELMDKANKEVAKEIWVKLKQSGIQLKNPPILFGADETTATETN